MLRQRLFLLENSFNSTSMLCALHWCHGFMIVFLQEINTQPIIQKYTNILLRHVVLSIILRLQVITKFITVYSCFIDNSLLSSTEVIIPFISSKRKIGNMSNGLELYRILNLLGKLIFDTRKIILKLKYLFKKFKVMFCFDLLQEFFLRYILKIPIRDKLS